MPNLTKLTTTLKIVGLCFMLGIVFWAKQAPKTFEIEQTLLPMPIFKYCSCDSATFCLNDEDEINLHVWYENAKNFTKGRND